jgi:archaellum component FlaF (FlaF/FlaG flagellin family)
MIRLRCAKNKKGLSTVIAQVLIISATISIGTIALSWALPALNLYQSTSEIYYQQRSNALKESFIIENVWFNSTASPKTIDITIRNVGSIEIRLVAIYINNTIYTNMSALPTIPVGQRSETIKISRNPPWIFGGGQTYRIIVATARGNQVVLQVGR